MRIRIANFRGRAPRVAPRLLPDGMSQIASVPRLLSGNLEAWKDNDFQFALAKKGSPYTDVINTIFPMDIDQNNAGTSGPGPHWLHWTDTELGTGQVSVDVAKGPIVGDTTERIYITGLDAPRWTDLNRATNPPPPGTALAYPYITYLLGVPAPGTAPVATVAGQDPSEPGAGTVIPIINGGAESDSSVGWTTEVGGTLLRHYSLGLTDPMLPGTSEGPVVAYEGEFYFYGGTAAVTRAYQDVSIAANNLVEGQSVALYYKTSTGANLGTASMIIQFLDGALAVIASSAYPYPAPTAPWSNGFVRGVIPDGAIYIRIKMILTNAGTAGVDENDGYIDGIELMAETFSYASSGNDLADWEHSANQGKNVVEQLQIDTPANDVFSFEADQKTVWVRRNFGLGEKSFTLSADSYALDNGIVKERSIVLAASNSGAGEGITIKHQSVERRSFSGSDDRGTTISELASVDSPLEYFGAWLTTNITATRTATGHEVTVQIVERDASDITVPDVVLAETTFNIETKGDWIYFKHWSNEGSNNSRTYLDNIILSLSATPASTGIEGGASAGASTSNYVFTYVNGNGEESGPSPVSNTVTREAGTSMLVTIVWSPPAGYDAQKWRLYRSVTGATGTIYKLVNTEGDIDDTQTEYEDTKTDDELGEPIATELFATPPANAHSIVATANGITYMASGNQLIPSEQNVPHAYPVEYRIATDYPIVTLGAMDTDIIIATQSHPYVAYGSTPGALVMAKLEKPQGCVSKRSLITIADLGVIYASPDGLTLVRRGTVQVITERLFSRKEWQALSPGTIHAVEHDGRYIGFYDNGTPAGFIFDPRPDGFGWIDLDFYASATFSNPLTDQLFLVIAGDLYVWDADAALRPYTWRSKEFKLPRPACFSAADVRLQSGGTCTMKLYRDGSGSAFFTKAITASGEFRMPAIACLESVEIEFTGTATVEQVTIGEEMGEVAA